MDATPAAFSRRTVLRAGGALAVGFALVVPTGTPVTFRVTSPDVVHGFLIAGTNVNSMVVPGYVAEVRTRFDAPGEHFMPCHEYCSVGHEGMWARVRVLDRADFDRLHANQARASCAG